MKAVEKLTSILQQKEDAAYEAEMLGMATSQFSQMDRSDRIRNYNFPNNRFTCYKLDKKLSLSGYFNQVEVQQELCEEYMDKKEDEKLEKLFERFKREIAKENRGIKLLEMLQQ